MSPLRLLTLGIGDAFSARWYSSCLALQAGQQWLLIDCPHPIRKIMHEASVTSGVAFDVPDVHALALTHLHADHASGLEGFAFYSRYVLGHRVRLLAHPRVRERIWDGLLAAGMRWVVNERDAAPQERQFEEFFDWIPLNETEPTPVGPFQIRCRPTVHSVPTTALFIEAQGRSLGYSADSAFDPELIDWLSPADLIVHEAGSGLLHSPQEELLRLPSWLRDKMRLIHRPDSSEFDAPSAIEALEQGRCYDV